MTNFRPTNAPAGRLVRLGIVLDLRNGPARVRQLAHMAERAGVDVLWVRDYLVAHHGSAFFPEVAIVFVAEPGQHYHLPLLLSPFGYSVYRGS